MVIAINRQAAFRGAVKETHGESQFSNEYALAADLCCLRLKAAQEALTSDCEDKP